LIGVLHGQLLSVTVSFTDQMTLSLPLFLRALFGLCNQKSQTLQEMTSLFDLPRSRYCAAAKRRESMRETGSEATENQVVHGVDAACVCLLFHKPASFRSGAFSQDHKPQNEV
jgi:hypothetical protein